MPASADLPLTGNQLIELFAAGVIDYAICGLDLQGRLVYWNEGAEMTLGYRREEVLGKSFSMLFTTEDREAGVPDQELERAAQTGRAEDERWHVRKDGAKFWSLGVTAPVRAADGSLLGFGKILRDRTDIKEVQEDLRNRATELSQSDTAKNTFLTTLAHELRTPLSVLANSVVLLRSEQAVQHLPRIAQMIERQVTHTKRLVDDLMDIARIGRSKMQLQVRALDLRDAAHRAMEMVKPLMEERQHDCALNMDNIPLIVMGDFDRLVQVLANILTNAAKYTPPPGRVHLHATNEANEAVLRITDNGIGIAADKLSVVFELFTQLHADVPDGQLGVGIGLALSRDLIALHGGSIQARSAGLNRGSEFIIRLPLVANIQGIQPEDSLPATRQP